jgi:hypothetical protein
MNNALHIERIPPLEEIEGFVSDRDRLAADGLQGRQRRAEYLMWRTIVRRELPAAEISYDDFGAPVVTNYPVHISVAHCPGWVAVAISEHPCAVDIEPAGRSVARHIAERFATEQELALNNPLAVWCGKEVLYKYARRPGLDFRRDLRIERIDTDTMAGRIEGGIPLEIKIKCEAKYLAAYIL